MENKLKLNNRAMILLVAILLIIGSIAFFGLDKTDTIGAAITGFVVAENGTNETLNETITQETIEVPIINETVETINETPIIDANQTLNETPKGKPEDKGKPEANQPPVWKLDVDEIIVDGVTTIDLNDYYSDKNNDTIGYALGTAENIVVEADNNIVTFKPVGNDFNSSVSITASDGNKSTTKEVTLIVPERTITIDLEYKSGSIYDLDDDGLEATTGIIDFTIENTNFNWDVDESNLCTRWETFSIEEEESTFVCYGASRCCQFVDLLATQPTWNEPFFSAFGQYGATANNIVSAQVLYVDYELAVEEPFAEIYNSEWSDLSASYYSAFAQFENVCVDTCTLTGFNQSSYTLMFDLHLLLVFHLLFPLFHFLLELQLFLELLFHLMFH